MNKTIFSVIVLFIVSMITILPLFSSGFFPMHDDTQVGRVVVMGSALRNGQFPVRWVSDLGYGYGYPIFNFYGPLPYYVGGILYALGLSGLLATKIMIGAGMVLSSIVFFFSIKQFAGNIGALLGAIFYSFAPYHAVQLYVRGSIGELWTLVFFPMVLYSVLRVFQRSSSRKTRVLGGIGIAGVILSHTLMGYVVVMLLGASTLLLLCIDIWKRRELRHIYSLFGTIALGLSLAAFFWLPAIVEMNYTAVAGQIGASADFHAHFVCVEQLWASAWGFAGSAPGCIDGMSFQIGKVHIVVFLTSVLLWLTNITAQKHHRVFMVLGCVLVGLSLFLMTQSSVLIWEYVPGFAYIQYPWRFLTIAMLGIAAICSMTFLIIRQSAIRFVGLLLLLVLCLYENSKYFQSQASYVRQSQEFESLTELRYRVSKISDEYLPSAIVRPSSESEVIRDTIPNTPNIRVEQEIVRDTYEKLTVTTGRDEEVTVYKAFFPGWKYRVNGKLVDARIHDGIGSIWIPSGRNVVELEFHDTPVRIIGNIISLCGIAYLLIIYGRKTIA